MFENWDSEIIYVGSCASQKGGLRRRVSQYFTKSDPSLRIDPFEIANVLWLRSDHDARWIETNFIAYLFVMGEPLRNITIAKKVSKVFNPNLRSSFARVDIWDDQTLAKELAERRSVLRHSLIEGLDQMQTIT